MGCLISIISNNQNRENEETEDVITYPVAKIPFRFKELESTNIHSSR